MPFVQRGDIRYFVFENLREHVSHAIFTREGGVSPSTPGTLSFGRNAGENPDHMRENIRRATEVLFGVDRDVCDVRQVHGCDVVAVSNVTQHDPRTKADGMISAATKTPLMMRFADCVPILFYDPEHHAVGMAHAGWRGTLGRVAQAVVSEMVGHYGTRPAALLAGIGPSIGPEKYYVGPEVVNQVQSTFPEHANDFLIWDDEGVRLDLWATNAHVLREAGLRVDHIEVAGVCTASHTDDWFSHRAESGHTGRFAALISLEKPI